jgi:hypothetical protein
VVVGSPFCTCDTSNGCPETHIVASLGCTLSITLLLTVPVCLVCGILRGLIYPSASAFTTRFLMTGGVVLTVLIFCSSAIELLFRIDR